jgi:catechol 2,3-dioxygenase-like lactoylglutathione lyase family enzyme
MTTDAAELADRPRQREPLPTVARATLHHIALTVTDLGASISWYEEVFGVRFQKDIPHQGGVGSLLADETRSLIIVLHRHDANDRARFEETVTGLDHVGFRVPRREDLVAWQGHLESHGIERRPVADAASTQSPIADEPYASVLVFRDPDNIQLELSCPPGA